MSRKVLAAPFFVAAAVLQVTWCQAAEFDLSLTGTPGVQFSGRYVLKTAGPEPRSERIEGTVPARFRFTGQAIRVEVRKESTPGTLGLELYRDGRLAGQGMATGRDGRVSVSNGDAGSGLRGGGGGGGNVWGGYGYGGYGGGYGGAYRAPAQ